MARSPLISGTNSLPDLYMAPRNAHFWYTFGTFLVHFWYTFFQKCTKSVPKMYQKCINVLFPAWKTVFVCVFLISMLVLLSGDYGKWAS